MFSKSFFTLAAAVAIAACGRIDNAVDCQSICDRYRSCFDNSYDTGTCASRCRSGSASDTDYQRKADVCSACIGDRSCASATFSCATECAGIVP